MSTAPHDALFKATFSQVERAAEELRHVLPPELLARVDLASLSLESGSFVDEALRERHTDLLFSLRLDGRDARIYLLFEHQSGPDPWMPLRLLRYMLRIWESCVAGGATLLPVVIPVVLHHGSAGWRAPTRFEALFDLPPEAAELTPHFRFLLDDLGIQSEAALFGRAASACTRLVLTALQQARSDRDLAELLRSWRKLIHELLRAPDGRRALELVFRYLFEVRGAAEFDAAGATIHEIDTGTESEETMQTIAQMLESRGMERGRQEGRQEGRREFFLGLLERDFGELPAHARERVMASDDAELARWSGRLREATSLDDIFANP
jgi:predicted transposase/invertase (TIGR01784 family)